MGLQPLTTSTLPVTLDEAKAHLRIDGTNDDATLTAYLWAALEYVERETRQQLCSREYLFTLDAFPADRFITLPKPPLMSVASVVYVDATGNAQTLSPSAYTVDTTAKPGRLVLNPGLPWPTTPPQQANAVRITFTAGYGAADAVPFLLRQCIKFMVGHFYENREGAIDRIINTVPLAVESIINGAMFPEAVG